MEDQQQQNVAEQQQQQQQRPGKVQLGEFWPQAPNAWFAAADLKFEVAHITSERERFAHAVGAMGFNVLCALLDLVETLPAVDPHTTLRGRLVLAHQLTPVQKATKCLQVVASNNQRPSEVLALLLEFCPLGGEGTAVMDNDPTQGADTILSYIRDGNNGNSHDGDYGSWNSSNYPGHHKASHRSPRPHGAQAYLDGHQGEPHLSGKDTSSNRPQEARSVPQSNTQTNRRGYVRMDV